MCNSFFILIALKYSINFKNKIAMKTKTLSLIIGATLVAAAVLTAGSCGNRSGKKAAITSANQLTEAVINYPIPTAYEVTNLINRAGVAYIIGITNPPAKAESYLTEFDKAINMGVYGADLAYVTTYNMKQETMDYMKVLRKLVDELQISTNFNTELARKVESNIDNKDSLINIISQSFYDTYNFLINNGKDDMSIMVLVGTWVEGLYITSMAANTSLQAADMLMIVANQKASLNTLVEILDAHKESADIAKLRQLLDPIITEYGKVSGAVSAEQSLQIGTVIEGIRSQLVK